MRISCYFFADSFIFSEVGNESMIEYDVTDQNWYLDIAKILPTNCKYQELPRSVPIGFKFLLVFFR